MQLVFVYNADSGVFNTLADIGHKIVSPDTYQCHLCELTHGYFTMRDEWSSFLQQMNSEIRFLHRDQFAEETGLRGPFPAIYEQQGNDFKLWMSKTEIDQIESTQALREKILNRLSYHSPE